MLQIETYRCGYACRVDHGPPERTAIPRASGGHPVFGDRELAAYLVASGVRVEEFRGNLWRNAPAPSPLSRYSWTALNRWVPLNREAVGYPALSALAYRCLAQERVPTTFGYTVFREISNYGERSFNRRRARYIRKALERYEYVLIDSPDVLLEQGWKVMADACAFRGQQPPMDSTSYQRRVACIFEARPPVVWAALADGRLVSYLTSYATGCDATLEKLYISPAHRDGLVGYGMYWMALTGWAATPGVRNAWVGASMPGGVDDFKISMGAVLEQVPVHSGMRLPVRLGYRVLKPDAMSLKDLRA